MRSAATFRASQAASSGRVGRGDADVEQQAALDRADGLAVDEDAGVAHPLQDRAHRGPR